MPGVDFCSLWQPSVDFFSWQTYRQTSIIITSNLVIMAGWCLENSLHKSWKPMRTYKIRAFGEHAAISGSCEWPRPMSHTIAYCRRTVWILSLFGFFFFLSWQTAFDVKWHTFFFFLICSLTQALLSDSVLDLFIFLLLFAGWWQFNNDLKSKIEVTDILHLLLRVSQMHHQYCICDQCRKNDHRRDCFRQWLIRFVFLNNVNCFQTKLK